jgi:glycosyltransferase involved in cell wall biosynthesis
MDKHMKILMPILHYPPVIGGFEIYSQNIAEGISKTDNVWVITSRVISVPDRETKGNLEIFRVSPWVLKDLSYSRPWFIVGAMFWILLASFKLIKKEKIELIHAQGFLGGILGYILKKITKIPYIFTIQSADFSVYHPRLNINIIKVIYQKIEKIIFKNSDFCHAVSFHLENHLKQRGAKKTITIPNGVSNNKFKPDPNKRITRKELGFDTDNLIVCVSRLVHKNGTHDLIEAAKYLKEEIEDFKIIICGDGSDRKMLEEMINKFSLKDRVFLLGDILHKDLPRYVACADIFIRPSLAEGFGIVFLEAMAAGLAVIGTPVGGIPDFLKDRENGLFCEPGNPKDIAQKIKLLITDKNLSKYLVESGLKMVNEEYSWEEVVKQIRNLYKLIVNKS